MLKTESVGTYVFILVMRECLEMERLVVKELVEGVPKRSFRTAVEKLSNSLIIFHKDKNLSILTERPTMAVSIVHVIMACPGSEAVNAVPSLKGKIDKETKFRQHQEVESTSKSTEDAD